MREQYRDIRNLISTPPSWFDEVGAPRYTAFAPHLVSDKSATEVALLRIRCQACRTQFFGAVSSLSRPAYPALRPLAEKGSIEYGDPPDCCDAGRTMSTETMEIVEFWERGGTWRRDGSLEWKVMQDG